MSVNICVLHHPVISSSSCHRDLQLIGQECRPILSNNGTVLNVVATQMEFMCEALESSMVQDWVIQL